MAVAAATLISILNYIGIKKAGDFQLVFTFLKVAIILSIVVIGFSYSGGSWQNFAGSFTGAKGGMAGFMAALVAALWAYDGWNDLNMVSGEISNPERNIPRALIFGVALVGVLYMLVNAAVQYVLPAAAIARSPRPASDAMAVVLGEPGRGHGVGRHGAVDARGHEWHGHERRAGALRRGPGPVFLFRAGGSASPLPHSLGGDCGTGGAGRSFSCCWEAAFASFSRWRSSPSGFFT